jgi:hypothetical protein
MDTKVENDASYLTGNVQMQAHVQTPWRPANRDKGWEKTQEQRTF